MPPIHLTTVSLADSAAYFAIFSAPAVCQFLDYSAFTQLHEAESFIQTALTLHAANKQIRYSIAYDQQVVGSICLYSLYWHQKRASIGYALHPDFWGKGIMSAALQELITIAKAQYGLNRLQATVLPHNRNSQRVLLKQGFIYEGLLQQYEIWEGRGFVDLQMYAKLL